MPFISAANTSHGESEHNHARAHARARSGRLRSVGAHAKQLVKFDRNFDELLVLVVIVSMTLVVAGAVRVAYSVKRNRKRPADDDVTLTCSQPPETV